MATGRATAAVHPGGVLVAGRVETNPGALTEQLDSGSEVSVLLVHVLYQHSYSRHRLFGFQQDSIFLSARPIRK